MKYKFYVPIVTNKNTVTYVNASKVEALTDYLPSNDIFEEFLKDQFDIFNNNGQFNTMKVLVELKDFESIKKQLNNKVPNQINIEDTIDVVLDKHPVVQFIKKQK